MDLLRPCECRELYFFTVFTLEATFLEVNPLLLLLYLKSGWVGEHISGQNLLWNVATSLNYFSSLLTSSPRVEVGKGTNLENIERKRMLRVAKRVYKMSLPFSFLHYFHILESCRYANSNECNLSKYEQDNLLLIQFFSVVPFVVKTQLACSPTLFCSKVPVLCAT